MNWQTQLFLIALMVIGYVLLWRLGRPLVPKLGRWLAAHRFWTDTIASLVMIIWGAGIWYLLISQNNYTNTLALVLGSFLIGAGIYFLMRQLLKKA